MAKELIRIVNVNNKESFAEMPRDKIVNYYIRRVQQCRKKYCSAKKSLKDCAKDKFLRKNYKRSYDFYRKNAEKALESAKFFKNNDEVTIGKEYIVGWDYSDNFFNFTT